MAFIGRVPFNGVVIAIAQSDVPGVVTEGIPTVHTLICSVLYP